MTSQTETSPKHGGAPDDFVGFHGENEANPMMVSYRRYNSVDVPYHHSVNSPFSFQHSMVDSKMFTNYISSITHSIQVVSESMFNPGAMEDVFSFKTLSMAHVPSDRTISSPLVFVTTLNMLVPPSIFALPFLTAHAGAPMLATIIVVGALCLYTALLVHTCQYQTSKTVPGLKKRVYCSYIDLGKVALNPYGEIIMLILLYTNFLSDLTTFGFLAAAFVHLFDTYYEIVRQVGVLVWGLMLLPLLWFVKKSVLSWFATVGMLGKLVAVVIVYIQMFTTYKTWVPKDLHLGFDWEYYVIGYGIVLHTFNCHILLPATEAGAKEPEKFRKVLKASFSLNIFMKFLLAAMGVAAYELSTHILLIPNMRSFGSFYYIVLALVILHIYSTRPRSLLIVAELLDNHVQPRITLMQKGTHGHYVWLFASRTFLVLTLVFLLIVIPRIDLVISFAGCLRGTANALVCPIAFYLSVNGRRLSKVSYVLHSALLVVSLLIGVFGTGVVVKAMIVGK